MDKVFDNAERLTLFREYAQKGLLLENVDFIQAINEFKSMAEDHIVRSSVTANQDMKSDAEAIFQQFIKVSLRKFMSCHSVSQTHFPTLSTYPLTLLSFSSSYHLGGFGQRGQHLLQDTRCLYGGIGVVERSRPCHSLHCRTIFHQK